MSKVKLEDISFFERYVNVELFGTNSDEDVIVGNLRRVYQFIDEIEGGISTRPLGCAFRKIKQVARQRYGRSKKYMISKRQVSNLIRTQKEEGRVFVKIPYTADYIFRAIFLILENYKDDDIEFPADIEKFRGNLRRICFYNYQSSSLQRVCDVNSPRLMRDLNFDINSDDGVLGKVF